jgi:acyl-coenzyme A synthetase/AMP-(fatty) acid ligase
MRSWICWVSSLAVVVTMAAVPCTSFAFSQRPAKRFPHLRHCVSAGEPLNPEVIETWKRATGLTIYEGYGQSESVVMIANCRARGDARRIDGPAAPGFEITLIDDKLHEVPIGEEGEIAVRVAPRRPLGLFREYWRNPDENTAHFRGDWYLTGDRARRDADGYHWFVGRADDVIKSAGYRFGPFEVESALIEHPAVVEAAVVGKADPIRGTIVKAFVVLRRECVPNEALVRELQEHCKRVTAPSIPARDRVSRRAAEDHQRENPARGVEREERLSSGV